MIKDLLKTMLEIDHDTNLKPSEKILLSSLILYHNHTQGYSYPNYENLMITLSTNRKATVFDNLKALEEKKYITIKKGKANKNLYFIHKYLFYVGEEKQQPKPTEQPRELPVDSNGKEPLKNQIHIDEVIQEDHKVIEIKNHTGFSTDQAKELLEDSGNDSAKVIKTFDIIRLKKNVSNEFKYTKWAIKNEKKIEIEYKPVIGESKPVSKFNNFQPREYDYDALEKRLLGWEDRSEDEEPKNLYQYMK
ncbi:helix-turn-helix domain-containing protein [Clostridium chromiireducens]|uniref:helix-turn-helix domain-containing protein n=1 Tax=Clostridium chromiireducens TaxID=225345 RepID=UPI003AF40D4D